MPKYVKAENGPDTSVIYTDTDGKKWKFSGGTRPWRNQNPGNLVVGNVSKRNGAIGKAGRQLGAERMNVLIAVMLCAAQAFAKNPKLKYEPNNVKLSGVLDLQT